MQSNSTVRTAEPKDSAHTQQPAPAQPSARERLEQVRASIRSVARNITISEGRLLDYESAEDMQRTISNVMRELEALQLTFSVMERKVR